MCDCDCELPKRVRWQKIREETAIELGRDLLRDGLVPFLDRLVGPENTARVFERHAGE